MESKSYVNRSYYADNRAFEPKDIIREFGLNFNVGNVVKYISRCGKKKGEREIDDISKAIVYLEFEIEALKKYRKDWGLIDGKSVDKERVKAVLRDWDIRNNTPFELALRNILCAADPNSRGETLITQLTIARDALKIYLFKTERQ